jgi:K+-transporting ATPase KdpF subunit
MAASHVYSWTSLHGALLSIHEGLRKNLGKGNEIMLIYLTAVIAAFLFIYLIVAIARPERF